jgi:hypothetical protein
VAAPRGLSHADCAGSERIACACVRHAVRPRCRPLAARPQAVGAATAFTNPAPVKEAPGSNLLMARNRRPLASRARGQAGMATDRWRVRMQTSGGRGARVGGSRARGAAARLPSRDSDSAVPMRRTVDDFVGFPIASMFRPIYAYLHRAEHEAAERVRRGVKVCSRCGHERPLADFNAERRARDRADCRECQHETARAIYARKVS